MFEITPEIRAIRARVDHEKQKLDAWFRNHSLLTAPVVAHRTGLRVLPFVIGTPPEEGLSMKQRHHVVTAFRYLALARLAIAKPNYALYDTCTALNTVGPKTKSSAGGVIVTSSFSAIGLSNPFPTRLSQDVIILDAIHAGVCGEGGREFNPPWSDIDNDLAYIESAKDWPSLMNQRLWLDRSPSDYPAPEPYHSRWLVLKNALQNDDPSWESWIEWYEQRLIGTAQPSYACEHLRLTLVPDGHLYALDSSDAGRKLWSQRINENSKLFKNDARKANRLMEKLLNEYSPGAGSAKLDSPLDFSSSLERDATKPSSISTLKALFKKHVLKS